MYLLSTEQLEQLGAEITTREIKQQPQLWKETFINYGEIMEGITNFLEEIKQESKGKVRVIFTGAGTSQYVGDTLVPYLNSHGDHQNYIFESRGTTDIVSAPYDYLIADETILLVSFARSGNSPESVAAIELTNQLIKSAYHLVITCAPNGDLAKMAQKDSNSFLFLMPAASNDQGFAMTGSFTCMTLAGLLIFDQTALEMKEKYIQTVAALGKEVVKREAEIQKWLADDFERIVYLGSGSLAGLTREAQLKILELTAGKIATIYDSSIGFRHGPKSFINNQTLVFGFIQNDSYTQLYDLDILNEIENDGIAKKVVGISQKQENRLTAECFELDTEKITLPEGYLALVYIMVAQTIALLTSVKVKNTPDRPSATGTVNRVVKGVTIHAYES
ncbi:SIS domain-containing protein [Melissococcus plutonius]|uniref:Predicted galactosamine-6-phosphate isomerase n=1 Tax=Melissococcus plutonius (strain ATCC 35311 / DSM 29964 / CIP 104052 / LMG 20360 / NCIMB 702443) TaxID=940190 RepID=F3Y8R4_MELPT|nr:SIS domain-containing protein [Melissococcus plutonius]AIM24555.1 putative tagatose-6-phosphate ketose/aldose isomerase AgaS [Melissococcus plutonius S1]KMT24622.1 putative tagatose-6-phosphate ketose/aldose isomerase AgaS [Melissococcus plutonius]KMT27335.1 putative tagatose-6-phosphate ketose/aldose isomerase AgaS [Melissococcus plutonius]KMT27508.1 putative tagatose-6-phosphate ketose/aldose isomerase AgaS [Melissococcus plutonius]KMT29282.1 putative tagatose-6-phosphate ketose/aldose is